MKLKKLSEFQNKLLTKCGIKCIISRILLQIQFAEMIEENWNNQN